MSWMEKSKKVMKYLMQIKVESFGVPYGVKVKNLIEMQSGRKNWREKITIKSSKSAWLLLRIWFLSKAGKSLIENLQEAIEFRVSGSKNWQICMNELLFYWLRFWIEINNWLIGWLMGERFYAKKIARKVTQ